MSDHPEREGILWLKVIEANDLTVSDDTKCTCNEFFDTCQELTCTCCSDIDPLVRFRLARPFGGHKTPHLATHPYHKSTCPKV